ncbi:MAG TPA: RNA polymerase sigma factor [Polyangiaceae bacterium]|jgi:RNA polymerase sigma-70 factor (ECF subfamily)|nr:RNA polymerase sigma factor [Polyangiaceae bacterium]
MAAVPGDASDETLMVRYQRGDRGAFTLLVRRHHRALYNFVLRQLRHQSLAEEITQEVFLRVVQSANEYKHESRFSTWAYAIARNLCVDQLRKAQHRRHPSLDQPLGPGDDARALADVVADPKPVGNAEHSAAASQMRATLIQAIETLPDDQREVYLLREVANLSFKEIAEVTAVPENTAKSRMRYALERLRSTLCDFEEYARALR